MKRTVSMLTAALFVGALAVPALAQSPAAEASPAASEPAPEASPAMTKHHHKHIAPSPQEAELDGGLHRGFAGGFS